MENTIKQQISPCISRYITNTQQECKVETVQYVDISICKNFISSVLLTINSHPILTQNSNTAVSTAKCSYLALHQYIVTFLSYF